MPRVALASQADLPAQAGASIADLGGNAVDAALAAMFTSWVCEPGYTALGSGAFMTVWSPSSEEPICLDGFAEVPGRGRSSMAGAGGKLIKMPYGVGVETGVGAAAVATPGALLAAERLWEGWGQLPWEVLFGPAIDLASSGFPISESVHTYYVAGAHLIFAQTPEAARLCMDAEGVIHPVGTIVTMPELAQSLEMIAAQGAGVLYGGELGQQIGAWMDEHGGLLSAKDLAAYEVGQRSCDQTHNGPWTLATPTIPAIGGEAVRALVEMYGANSREVFDAPAVARFAEAMNSVFTRRDALLYGKGQPGTDLTEDHPISESSSTSHVSAVDSDGLAVSLTSSCGYSAGVIVPGTGILLNNMLGEQELNANPEGLKPGTRILSNMSPAVARSNEGDVIAIGAAGSQRIVSSLARVWIGRTMTSGMASIDAAVDAPRCHLRMRDGHGVLVYEPGIDVSEVACETEAFDESHMYFGCVQAAQLDSSGSLTAKADPRRAGGIALGGA